MPVTLKPEVLTKWPPGGWRYSTRLQDGSTWNTPTPLVLSFRQTVAQILEWRRKNPIISTKLNLSIDADVIAQELIDQTVARLQAMKGGHHYLMSAEATTMPTTAEAQKKTFAQSIWAATKQKVAAAGNASSILTDWLGDSAIPVTQELSNARAGVCAVCPLNSNKPWDDLFEKSAIAVFTKVIEVRNGMKLKTDLDENIGTCLACSCILKLKVHVPLKHIMNNTEWNTVQKLDPGCWVKHETP